MADVVNILGTYINDEEGSVWRQFFRSLFYRLCELVWQYRMDADAEDTHQDMYSEYRDKVTSPGTVF